MKGLLFVRCAGKLLPVNMTESATKDSILERKSLCAKESSNRAASGDVAADLLVLMHWDGISARKRAGSA